MHGTLIEAAIFARNLSDHSITLKFSIDTVFCFDLRQAPYQTVLSKMNIISRNTMTTGRVLMVSETMVVVGNQSLT